MRTRSTGSALVSLAIALAVSTAIALAAVRLIAQSNAEFQRLEQLSLMEDQAAYAIDLIAQALHQAGHVDATQPMTALPARPFDGAVNAIDNASVVAGVPAVDAPVHGGHLGSDVLVIRFAGDAAGTMKNCAGFAVPPSLAGVDDKGISIFHVALDALSEPELRCKYRGSSQWSSQAIASGVESLQVLFGVDTDGDGLANDFVSASRTAEIEAATVSSAPSLRTRIVAVHLALLLRSPQMVKSIGLSRAVDMFGRLYGDRHEADDPGTRIMPSRLMRDRLHRRYDAVIFLNNSLHPDA